MTDQSERPYGRRASDQTELPSRRRATDPVEPPAKLGLLAELKRRNVLRAAAIYVAAVWALSQGFAQLLPAFNAPAWITRWFVIACVIGFPFWVAFAWYYELTPEGLKRESEVDRSQSIAHVTGRKLDFWIIGVMAVAIVLLITNQFVLHRDVTSKVTLAHIRAIDAQLAKVPFKSVAVLPLTNEGGDPKQQYFSDGLSEELISDLTQITGLKVIGKFSSFKFRDSHDSPGEIGAALGVSHLIEGSVRQVGDRIRVNVNLIRAQDGSNVWSHSYNEQLQNVFKIQSNIGQAVATSLKIKLLGNAIVSSDKPPSGDVEAYRLMLQGHALTQRQTATGLQQGIALLDRALKLDPNYAYAWGVLSTALINQGQIVMTGAARKQAFAQARMAANKQQILAPDSAATHLNRGYLLANLDKDPLAAMAEFRRALQLAPNDGTAMTFLAYGMADMGQLKPAAALYRKAINTDPLRADWYGTLASILLGDGQLDAAEQVTQKALSLQPDFPGTYANLAVIDILRGKPTAAAQDAAREPDPVLRAWIQAMALQIDPDRDKADTALRDYIAAHAKTEPYFVADLYAVRKQPTRMFKWLVRAWNQHDPAFSSLLYDPFPLAYRDDPRFAKLCRQAGLPLPGKPLTAATRSRGF